VATASSGGAQRRFRISFVTERIVEADTISDALKQAVSLGALDISSIRRVD
jgi:hypothetical protein